MSYTVQARIDIVVDEAAAALEHRDQLTRQLRLELLELDVNSVEAVTRPSPPAEGAKGTDPVTIGALLVALSVPGGVLTSLIGLAQSWITRNRQARKLVITIDGEPIEIEAATAEEQRALIQTYIQRHSTPPELP